MSNTAIDLIHMFSITIGKIFENHWYFRLFRDLSYQKRIKFKKYPFFVDICNIFIVINNFSQIIHGTCSACVRWCFVDQLKNVWIKNVWVFGQVYCVCIWLWLVIIVCESCDRHSIELAFKFDFVALYDCVYVRATQQHHRYHTNHSDDNRNIYEHLIRLLLISRVQCIASLSECLCSPQQTNS